MSPLIASVCGRQLPGSLHSTGDALFLRFTSDGSINGRGFNATFSKGEQHAHEPNSYHDDGISLLYIIHL